MARGGKSIYRLCRDEANMSREAAAELLSISTESLGAYERGETKVPCTLVLRMAEIYRNPAMAYRHLTENCPVGQRVLPDEKSVMAQATRLVRTGLLFLVNGKKRIPDVATVRDSVRTKLV